MSTTTKAKIINSKLQQMIRLMDNIIVKQEVRANKFETEEMYLAYSKYKFSIEELDTLSDFDDTWDLLTLTQLLPEVSVGLLEKVVSGEITLDSLYAANWFDSNAYDRLLDNRRKWRIDTYVEPNNYYRMLIGQPPVEDGPEDFIYIDGKPIHEISMIEYYKLKRSKKLDVLIAEHPEKEYLQYIGKEIPLYDAREAEQFQVLWTAQNTESSIYCDVFNRERRTYMKTYHNEHLTRTTDYNEAYELVQLKLRACIYYNIHMYSPSLDKTTFSKEETEILFKEFGLSFPKNMPAAYRDAISFVLSYLVSFKGTNFAVKFIADKVFAGLSLYKYFIRKRHKTGIKYPVDPDTPPDQIYDVEFILRPFDATNIIDSKDNTREEMILTYDDVVQMDPRWRDSQELKDYVFNADFSYLESKFLSLDNMIDINELTIGISVITRMIIEHKDYFESFKFVYNVTGYDHSFFNIWLYFLALYFYMLEKTRTIAPDTLTRIIKLYGFRVPKNIEQIKIYWIWYFNMRKDIRHMLKEFPDALASDDDFLMLLVKIDKAIGLSKDLDKVIAKCQTFDEVKLVLEIYKLVRIVNTTPSAYGDNFPTIDGMSYIDYLQQDELLFLEFERCVNNEDINVFIMELDNCAQFLLQIINDHKTEEYPLNNIVNTIGYMNMMVGGLSKYLLYILKLFKAYSTDFVTDGNILQMDDEYNFNLNLDNTWVKYDINYPDRWNMSQYEWVEKYIEGIRTDLKVFHDYNSNNDGVYLVTDLGDVKISV